VDSLSLEIFKSHLDIVLVCWLHVDLLEQRAWTSCPPEVPSNTKQSVILWDYAKMEVSEDSTSGYNYCLNVRYLFRCCG